MYWCIHTYIAYELACKCLCAVRLPRSSFSDLGPEHSLRVLPSTLTLLLQSLLNIRSDARKRRVTRQHARCMPDRQP